MLEIIVFVCGAVVMILEMVGSRVLAPYLGSSIVVWTSLIGVILGCLSLGYWWGGRIADRSPSHNILSHIILLSAICIAVVAISKSMVLDWVQTASDSVHAGATAATLILFAPPSVLLGMVSPYAVKLKMHDLERTGRIVGNLYAVSTVGSIFGTFLAGYFLIAFFGSTRILIFLALSLVAASLLAYRRHFLLQASASILLILLYLTVESYNRHLAGREFYDIDTNYNRVIISTALDTDTGRNMRIMMTNPKAIQSAVYIDHPQELALEYTKFYQLATHFRSRMERVLMLGGGGYSFPRHLLNRHPAISVHVVELDPRVTLLARRFFSLPEDPRLFIHHEDARTFLNRNQAQFDVILGDTFNSHYAVPFHLTTLEVVKKLHDALEEDGVVMTNILSSIDGPEGRFLRAEYATFCAVFPQVYIFPVACPSDGERWQNIMLVALKSHKRPDMTSTDVELDGFLRHLWTKPVPRDVPILTDDFAPVDRYVLNWP